MQRHILQHREPNGLRNGNDIKPGGGLSIIPLIVETAEPAFHQRHGTSEDVEGLSQGWRDEGANTVPSESRCELHRTGDRRRDKGQGLSKGSSGKLRSILTEMQCLQARGYCFEAAQLNAIVPS